MEHCLSKGHVRSSEQNPIDDNLSWCCVVTQSSAAPHCDGGSQQRPCVNSPFAPLCCLLLPVRSGTRVAHQTTARHTGLSVTLNKRAALRAKAQASVAEDKHAWQLRGLPWRREACKCGARLLFRRHQLRCPHNDLGASYCSQQCITGRLRSVPCRPEEQTNALSLLRVWYWDMARLLAPPRPCSAVGLTRR